jgi:hypothetical protein
VGADDAATVEGCARVRELLCTAVTR